MNQDKWVVVADVGASVSASRTDSCGDMEQMEQMELILVSHHDTKEAADQACAAKRMSLDGWAYSVISKADYDQRTRSTRDNAA